MKPRKIPQNVRAESIRDIISLQLKGYSASDIKSILKERLIPEYKVTPTLCGQLITEANKVLHKEHNVDIIYCIDLHIIIYEEIFKWFAEYGDVNGQNRALYQKEKLLGLHKEENKVVVNNRMKLQEKVAVTYNLDKLTQEEKTALNRLLLKSKKS